jgi:hypothetical protein
LIGKKGVTSLLGGQVEKQEDPVREISLTTLSLIKARYERFYLVEIEVIRGISLKI